MSDVLFVGGPWDRQIKQVGDHAWIDIESNDLVSRYKVQEFISESGVLHYRVAVCEGDDIDVFAAIEACGHKPYKP